MNTTTILIENLIQGLETFAWIALVIFSLWDYRLLDLHRYKDYLAPISFLALASFYGLGVVVDTMYYHLFTQRHEARWIKTLLGAKEPTLSTMVFKCILTNGDLAKLLLERQAHLRLLRVTVVNAALVTLGLLLFLHLGLSRHSPSLSLGVATIGTVVFLSAAYTWRKLYNYYVTIVITSYTLIMAAPKAAGKP
jgi:hypothetical protein